MRSGTPAHQAEEIVQDVMLTVWRKAAMFDPHRAPVSAWVYQIARNRQIDILRRENRPLPEELKLDVETEPDASQILAVEQEASHLKTALSRLKPLVLSLAVGVAPAAFGQTPQPAPLRRNTSSPAPVFADSTTPLAGA